MDVEIAIKSYNGNDEVAVIKLVTLVIIIIQLVRKELYNCGRGETCPVLYLSNRTHELLLKHIHYIILL